MIRWAMAFLIVALAMAVLGFTALAGEAARIAHGIFFVFLVLFMVSLVMGWAQRRNTTSLAP